MIKSKTVIDEYADTAGARRKAAHEYSGTQAGDPVRGATAIIKAVDATEPPLRLLLGSDALQLAQARLETLKKNFDAWTDLTVSTDFPKD